MGTSAGSVINSDETYESRNLLLTAHDIIQDLMPLCIDMTWHYNIDPQGCVNVTKPPLFILHVWYFFLKKNLKEILFFFFFNMSDTFLEWRCQLWQGIIKQRERKKKIILFSIFLLHRRRKKNMMARGSHHITSQFLFFLFFFFAVPFRFVVVFIYFPLFFCLHFYFFTALNIRGEFIIITTKVLYHLDSWPYIQQ